MQALQISLFDIRSTLDYGESIVNVAQSLLPQLKEGHKLSKNLIQQRMSKYFNGSDSEGVWNWKDAYEALEVASLLYLREQQAGILSQDPLEVLKGLELLQSLLLTHANRSDEQLKLQQFSTPLTLAFIAAFAAQIQLGETLLEPSAGTGILAQLAQCFGAKLVLNELSDNRAGLLRKLFPTSAIYQYNAEHINDYLASKVKPTVVLMNPPFSVSPEINKRYSQAIAQHIESALKLLAVGGRLVCISPNSFSSMNDRWSECFERMNQNAQVTCSVGINGGVFAKSGTSVETRLTVIDKIPNQSAEPLFYRAETLELSEVLELIQQLPVRGLIAPEPQRSKVVPFERKTTKARQLKDISAKAESINSQFLDVKRVEYALKNWQESGIITDSLYEVYQPQRIEIQGAHEHPSILCESVALATVPPPAPSYQPLLPEAVLKEGRLSAAQLESVIYAGEAHSGFLAGTFTANDTLETLSAVGNGDRYRRGWFLGDSTGTGKGRQVAGIILDNWCQGRTKAIWVSKSSALIEDARRDWCALGGHPNDIVDLSKFRLGQPIEMTQGILFTTYATLRSSQGAKSRLQQIRDWCGTEFEGAIAFDEAHAMGNAMAEKSTMGMKKASLQGTSGIRLQNALPNARVVYVSATGATKVMNLAYASRLGLWQTGDFPFGSREDFVQSIESGGIAAMEVVARDLKALGLYLSRTLSFEGVEYEALEVELTAAQIKLYDQYSNAFQVIHTHLEEALKATNITGTNNIGGNKTLNRNAKAAALSQFESHKQRFFNHLLMSMKCPDLIRAIEGDINKGHAVVIQLTSTNEELMTRRLAEIPTAEWSDLNIDLTPREYVLDYLSHGFPVQLHQIYTDEEGEERSKPVFDSESNPVYSQDALEMRDRMIDTLASLPPMPGALDQLLWHFGADQVAEVTGRKRRILKSDEGKLQVKTRPASANLGETQEFMDDKKRILIFSDAGGTGRSYHADANALNICRRVHYLLEPGWRADNAIQGLGRTHRTNQVSAPLFRPVTTNVKGEKRFISTIARRLDSLGALTKGQRQTGGNGIFAAKDNLESVYAESALEQLYEQVRKGLVPDISLGLFQAMTGLKLYNEQGELKENLPPLRTFLNRLLALTIDMQNRLFDHFEMLLITRIEGAIKAGIYDCGVETIRAEGFRIESTQTVYTHPQTKSETHYLQIEKKERVKKLSAQQAILRASRSKGTLVRRNESEMVAIALPTNSIVKDDGEVVSRVSLTSPSHEQRIGVEKFWGQWSEISESEFIGLWDAQLQKVPDFKTETLHLMTGILLPIWKSIPRENSRVFRLQTDGGEKILGRLIEARNIGKVAQKMDLNCQIKPVEVIQSVLESGETETLLSGVCLRRSMVAGSYRLELTDCQSFFERLEAIGCFSEIIQWRKRIFIPTGERAGEVFEAVLEVLGRL
jgi:predicted RNA methylase